jgi:hypothetical protein
VVHVTPEGLNVERTEYLVLAKFRLRFSKNVRGIQLPTVDTSIAAVEISHRAVRAVGPGRV